MLVRGLDCLDETPLIDLKPDRCDFTPLAPPLSYMGPGVAGFMVLGVIYMIYLYRTNPHRRPAAGRSSE